MAAPRVYQTVNPWTGQLQKSYPDITEQELEAVIQKLDSSPVLSLEKREECMNKLSELILANQDEFARVLAEDMGKPVFWGKLEAEFTGNLCKYYAEITRKGYEKAQHEEQVDNGLKKGVRYEPLGIILAVKPFNFPLACSMICSIPNLMAGNKILLKPAECCPQVGLKLAEFAKAAGFEGYFETAFIPINLIEKTVSDVRIKGVHLTGHKNTGKALAELCGKHMKRITCELGGSDPFMVCDDANLEETVKLAARARLVNTGQICIAAKRFLVHESVYDQFVEKLTEEVKINWHYGDPKDPQTQMGPMARKDFVEAIERQVNAGINEGAQLKLGGKPIQGESFRFEPTILADVKPNNSCFTNEVFGPVFVVTKVSSNEELIKLGNQTEYGLAASIHTSNLEKAYNEYLPKIDAGNVSVNAWTFEAQDCKFPFGGCKNSGIGREMHGFDAVKEFTNEKTYYVKI